MTLARVASAEVIKLRALPVVVATALGTILTAVVLSAAIAASATAATDAVQVTLSTIPFLQIGVVLLGVLAVATEYQGGQMRTTLVAMPRRATTLLGKGVVFLGAAALTGCAAIGAGWLTAEITLSTRLVDTVHDAAVWSLAGAGAYLVLIGSLTFALTLLFRSLIPPLVTMLSLVTILSPLASTLTEHARWLPDRAGGLLYLADTDTVLDAGTGALILIAWIAVTGIAASATFVRRDA